MAHVSRTKTSGTNMQMVDTLLRRSGTGKTRKVVYDNGSFPLQRAAVRFIGRV